MVGSVFFPRSPRHLGFEAAKVSARGWAVGRSKVALTVDADDDLMTVVAALKPDILQLHSMETRNRWWWWARFGLPVMKALPIETGAGSRANPALRRGRPALFDPAHRGRHPSRRAWQALRLDAAGRP